MMKKLLTHSLSDNRIAVLGSLCIFLSAIEYLFPKPLPFMRLGLANLPLLLALEILDVPSFFILVALKVVGQAMVNGSLASYVFIFSLCGSTASAVIMLLFYKTLKDRITFVGISVAGSLASNIVQILLSIVFIFGEASWKILPAFLFVGILSGFFMGLFAQYFSQKSIWWQSFSGKTGIDKNNSLSILENEDSLDFKDAEKGSAKRVDYIGRIISPQLRFLIAIIIIPAFLYIKVPLAKAFVILIFFIITYLSGRKIRFLSYFILVLFVTVFNLFVPAGKVLLSIYSFRITSGALESGVIKGMTLVGLMLISFFSVAKDLRLPGRFGRLLSKTFLYLEKLFEYKGKLNPGNPVGSLDFMLVKVFSEDVAVFGNYSDKEKKFNLSPKLSSMFYFVAISITVWGIFFFQELFDFIS
ncbi:MAG: Gx transporter family protein [Spirochaetales bacterium]|nr:Gx transporter family protein [Spirochaetales bacterium]